MAGFVRGALAGAAGSTALNAVSYLDMVVRARPASSVPERMVEKASAATKIEIPGTEREKQNRIQGLGPLLGIGVGTSVGAVSGTVHQLILSRGRRLPFLVGAVLIGAGAMAASDIPLKLSGVSDPRTWTGKDWLSDALPHLAYGIVTEAVIRLSET